MLNFFFERIFLGGSTNLTICLELFSFVLMYVGLVWYLVLIGDKPFSSSWKYLGKSKKFIYVVVGMFFAFALIGYFIPAPEFIVEQVMKILEEILEKTKDMNGFELTRFIFFNNIQSSFIGMLFGVFLGIFPIISTIANGYILGFVACLSVQTEGALILWRLIPHGIFELPAIFISLGLGLRVGTFVFQKNKLESFRKYLMESLIVFVFVVIPLLILAAIIEGALIAFGV